MHSRMGCIQVVPRIRELLQRNWGRLTGGLRAALGNLAAGGWRLHGGGVKRSLQEDFKGQGVPEAIGDGHEWVELPYFPGVVGGSEAGGEAGEQLGNGVDQGNEQQV